MSEDAITFDDNDLFDGLDPREMDKDRRKYFQGHQSVLPYDCESVEEMDQKLDVIAFNIAEAIRQKDYDVGLILHNHRLECWLSLHYPMKRTVRAKLSKLYYNLAITPGLDDRFADLAVNMAASLFGGHANIARLDIEDIQFDWRPILDIIKSLLDPPARQRKATTTLNSFIRLAYYARRFFPPGDVPEMLDEILPSLDGTNVRVACFNQALFVTLIPRSHPQYYLKTVFVLWGGFDMSEAYSHQWIALLSSLVNAHLDPTISDPVLADKSRFTNGTSGSHSKSNGGSTWTGLKQDVGIFTTDQWDFLMTKALLTLGIPVGSVRKQGGFIKNGDESSMADHGVETGQKKDRLRDIAVIIVGSMSQDSADPACPAGSKALESLTKLITATEGFFHPSNHGHWSGNLFRLVHYLTSIFANRWLKEQRESCKTPLAWRLTDEIKKQFVLCLRTPILLAIFSKSSTISVYPQAALRTLAYISPELIIPSVLERAYPALEGLLETSRTITCLSALTAVGVPLMDRQKFPEGAKHVAPLLEMILPGIDVNDPVKTTASCMFVMQIMYGMVLDDFTTREKLEWCAANPLSGDEAMSEDPQYDDNGNLKLSRDEENLLVRDSTSTLGDWVNKFLSALLTLYDNLPEPSGKSAKVGGKMEERMIWATAVACEMVMAASSDRVFDSALHLFFDHMLSSPQANTIKTTGYLAGLFGRVNPQRCLEKMLPRCITIFKSEIAHGAASVRSTSTADMTGSSQTTFHCVSNLLMGILSAANVHILTYKAELLELLCLMRDKCLSEKGYAYTGHVLSGILNSLVATTLVKNRTYNSSEWESEEYKNRGYLYWGKQKLARETEFTWHVPNDEEIDFAITILREVVGPALDRLEYLVSSEPQDLKDKDWANELCRYTNLLQNALSGSQKLAPFHHTKFETTDMGDEVSEFIPEPVRCKTNLPLQSDSDPRRKVVLDFRERAGNFLHNASVLLSVRAGTGTSQDDSVDCIKMVLTAMTTLILEGPTDNAFYSHLSKNYQNVKELAVSTSFQRRYPRVIWQRHIQLYLLERERLNSTYRPCTPQMMTLIMDTAGYCLSKYTAVRKSAQKHMETISTLYDGLKGPLLEHFMKALEPGTDVDAMKGSLYMLNTGGFLDFAMFDWRFASQYMLSILECQHQEKPSIQAKVKKISGDFTGRLVEPSTSWSKLETPTLTEAIDDLQAILNVKPNADLSNRVRATAQARVEHMNKSYADLVQKLLEIAQTDKYHWRYQAIATRLLLTLIRRDQPVRRDVAAFFVQQMVSEFPHQRTYGIQGTIKLLLYVKLRTFRPDLHFAGKSQNPLKRTIELNHTSDPNFTKTFIRSFSEPITSETILVDKCDYGWLCWPKKLEGYAVPPPEGPVFEWETASKEALDAMLVTITVPKFWADFSSHLAVEMKRKSPSNEHCNVVKSIMQMFEDAPLEAMVPTIEKLLSDKGNRHQIRAGLEFMDGALRGTKHWPLTKQAKFSELFDPLYVSLVTTANPDTFEAIDSFIEDSLYHRDPRRVQGLIKAITALEVDPDSLEYFRQSSNGRFVASMFKSLTWHSEPWADRYRDMCKQNLKNPFTEVRAAVADLLRCLSEYYRHPSYPSAGAFVAACESGDATLLERDESYEAQIDEIVGLLQTLRQTRQPTAKVSQQPYDSVALLLGRWILECVASFRMGTILPFTTRIIPELIAMQEIQDNKDLQAYAKVSLAAIANITFSKEYVPQIFESLLGLLKSTSWRQRLDTLPLLQVFYFHQLYMLSSEQIATLMSALRDLLKDSHLEVREGAAISLSGIVRCSQRKSIDDIQRRVLKSIRTAKVPRRKGLKENEMDQYQSDLKDAHAAVLASSSLIRAWPYEVPEWVPQMLIETCEKFENAPAPVSTTVKELLAEFRKTHADSWQEDQKIFSEDHLTRLQDLLIGSSYYA